MLIDQVDHADFNRRPERIRRGVVEREGFAGRSCNRVTAIDIHLQPVGQAQVELEVRRNRAPRILAPHQAGLEVELTSPGGFELQVGRLEVAPHVRSPERGVGHEQHHERHDSEPLAQDPRQEIPNVAGSLGDAVSAG